MGDKLYRTWEGTILVGRKDSYRSNKHFSKNVLEDKEAQRERIEIAKIEVVELGAGEVTGK